MAAGVNFKQGEPYQSSLTKTPSSSSVPICEQQQEASSTGEPNTMAKIQHG